MLQNLNIIYLNLNIFTDSPGKLDKKIMDRVKRPLLARVPSLARFFDNLTEITCVKEWVVEFFFTEAVNTVLRQDGQTLIERTRHTVLC